VGLLGWLRRFAEHHFDTEAAALLSPLIDNYLPWSSSAMRPSAMVVVLNDIILNNQRCIVECGSGISTILISKLLATMNAGHLYSIENNEAWSRMVKARLEADGTANRCTFINASLTTSARNAGVPWYDEDILRKAPIDDKIDLLLVDGPEAYKKGQEMARYPAVPFFREHLSSRYTVILDDIDRAGEREIIRRWSAMLSRDYQLHRLLHGNIGVITTASTNIA
jgi:Methyltransferase domain